MLTSFLIRKDQTLHSDVSRAELLRALNEKDSLLWVDLQNPNDFEVEILIEVFNFHPLAIEDCLNDHSYPKIDEYENHLFMVTNLCTLNATEKPSVFGMNQLELDIFSGRNFLVTVHKESIPAVATVMDVFRKRPGYFAEHGAEFLLHATLDHCVDSFQPVLEYFDERVDALEDEVCNENEPHFLENFMQTKKDLFKLRRVIMPQREMLGYLTRHPAEFISKKRVVYYRDIYDHLVRLQEVAESHHESLTAALQAYFSYSSHRLNDVMRRLTVLATLATPVLIIASLYGMNFHHMPELHWKWGYPFSIFLMFGMSAALLIWMKQKKWI